MPARFATICLVTILWVGINPPLIRAGDDNFSRATLKGISSLDVIVEPLGGDAKTLGLNRDVIQTDVELKLRLAGMRVVTGDEGLKLPGSPYLYVNIEVVGARAASVYVGLQQTVLLARNAETVPGVPTWSVGGVIANPTTEGVRNTIKDSVDQFLNAWLSVNPKK